MQWTFLYGKLGLHLRAMRSGWELNENIILTEYEILDEKGFQSKATQVLCLRVRVWERERGIMCVREIDKDRVREKERVIVVDISYLTLNGE